MVHIVVHEHAGSCLVAFVHATIARNNGVHMHGIVQTALSSKRGGGRAQTAAAFFKRIYWKSKCAVSLVQSPSVLETARLQPASHQDI
jgi:hypothetical protein